ncbi:MAG: ABC transporter substrate-binding protein [Nitriliruptoraceae bacterium]
MLASLLLACTTEPTSVEEPALGPIPQEEPTESSAPAVAARAGGTLRIGLVVDPVSIDPRFVVDDEGELLVDALFDPLVRTDAEGEIVPAAASRWEVRDDGATFVLQLREATFHDGSPVTAHDFKRTFDRIADSSADPPSFLAYLLADVVGIDAAQTQGGGLDGVIVEDDRTLRIELTAPQPGFLTTLSDPSLVPTPPAADDDPEAYGREPIGNGAFAMAGPRELGAFLRLVRFEDHHDPALLDEVLFTLYDANDGGAQQWQDLLEGQLQISHLAPSRRDEAVERFGRSRDGYTGPGVLDGIRSPVYLYGFDTTRAPFDDARLRRAISLAIDREALATEATEGTRVPATSLVPPGIPGSQSRACDGCVHDPEAARQLLEEVVRDLAAPQEPADPADGDGDAADGDGDAAGGDGDAAGSEGDAAEGDGDAAGSEGDETDGEAAGGDDDAATEAEGETTLPPAAEVIGPVTLTYNRGTFHGAIAEQLADDIQTTLGLEVDFQGQELAPFVRGVRRGDVGVFRLGWDVGEPTPQAYLYPMFHSSQVGLDNLTRFADAEVDALLDRARATSDARQRLVLLREAERRVLEELPAIPLLWYRHDVVVRPEVQDLVYTPLGRLRLSEVWLDTDVDPAQDPG